MADFSQLVVKLELQQQAFQKGMDDAAKRLAKVQQSAKQTQSALGGLQAGLKAVQAATAAAAAAFAAFKGVEAITKAADQINNLKGSFTALLGDGTRATDMMGRVFDIVARTGAPLEAVGGAVQRLSIALKEVGASNQQIATIAETFVKLGKVGGASTAETAAGLQQLGQALASGKLGGDELKSIRENAPLVAQAIADGMGVTVGALKELGEQGQLTTTAVANAMIKAAAGANAAFANMPVTFEQALNKMDSQSTQFLAAFDKASGLTKNLVAVADSLTTSFKNWTAELENANGKLSAIGAIAKTLDVSFRVVAGVVAAINFQLELSIRAVTTLVLLAADVASGFRNVGAIMADFARQTALAAANLVEFEKRMLGIQAQATAAQARAAARGDELRTVAPITGGGGGGGGGGGAKGKSDIEREAEALKKRGEALAANVDALNAFNQKMIEYKELLEKGAISDVIFAKAVEQAKQQLTQAGLAMTASTDPMIEYQKRVKAITDEYLKGAIGAQEWIDQLNKAKEEADNAGKKKKEEDPMKKWIDLAESATEKVGAGLGEFFSDLIQGSITAAEAFNKMVKSIISDLAKLLAEFAAKEAAKFIIKSLFGSTGPAAAGAAAMPSMMLASRPPTFNAAASLAPSPFATPRAANGNEAVGGAASGASPWNVTVNNNAPGVDVTTSTRSDGGLEVTIDKMRSVLAQDVMRGGNNFSRSLESAYSLGRGR